jgi:preprotein translocase subunit SecD
MNRYPVWLNVLVLVVLLTGLLFALPNLYGSVPAIQLADRLGEPIAEAQLQDFVETVREADIEPEAVYLKDERAVLRFDTAEDQAEAGDRLRARYGRDLNIALTLAPKLPAWVRGLGLNPMSLGLDLRGGVYVLLEVDMASAIEKRLESYQQDFDDRLREARIRHRVDLDDEIITVRLADSADYDAARNIVRDADSDVLIDDGTDDKAFTVRMSETQIRARQDFAIEQNITTLRNRVDELGVAEPLVQRQGIDRIVVQLPGVQDPTELDKILTATATVEFRLVDQSGNQPGSRQYPGRGEESAQILKREVIASGDEIVNASAGFSAEGQPAVNITLDAAGGERMLATTRDNLNKPMSTVFIEWREETVTPGDKTETRRVKSEEIINTATIRGVFKNNFQITGLNPIEASDLAKLLRAGALAAPVYKVDDRTIGPTLGQDNIDRGFRAIQIGFLAVIFTYYGVNFLLSGLHSYGSS